MHFATEISHHGDPRLSVGDHILRTLSVDSVSELQAQYEPRNKIGRHLSIKNKFPRTADRSFLG